MRPNNSPWPMRCLTTALVCSLLFLLEGCQPNDNTPKTKANQAAADERLWLTPPQDWILVSNIADKARHVRYADPQEPSHSLTIESRDNITVGSRVADPLDVVEQLAESEQKSCRKVKNFNTFSGFEQGLATVVKMFICEPSELASGRVRLLKIIQGRQKTYLVALEHLWSATATSPKPTGQNSNNPADRVAAWSLFMRQVRVCAASGCQQLEGAN